jgi:hypothetical protein
MAQMRIETNIVPSEANFGRWSMSDKLANTGYWL